MPKYARHMKYYVEHRRLHESCGIYVEVQVDLKDRMHLCLELENNDVCFILETVHLTTGDTKESSRILRVERSW